MNVAGALGLLSDRLLELCDLCVQLRQASSPFARSLLLPRPVSSAVGSGSSSSGSGGGSKPRLEHFHSLAKLNQALVRLRKQSAQVLFLLSNRALTRIVRLRGLVLPAEQVGPGADGGLPELLAA